MDIPIPVLIAFGIMSAGLITLDIIQAVRLHKLCKSFGVGWYF
jgi:hypothetical protein